MSKVSVKRHLRELQWRFLLVAVFFITGAALAYQFQAYLIPALLDPLNGQKLVYLNPAGGFSFIFLISIYVGLALALPILIQQLYAFLRPALPESARKKSFFIIIGSFLLLLAGIAFGYFIAVPNALTFLYSFADQFVEASLTAESYLNFMIAYTVGIGLVFQLPLLLLLAHAIKPLTPGGLLKSEKWVVLVAFIIAAIITPTPDPINQAIIAGPVVVVYQIGVIAVLISIAKAKAYQKRTEKRARKTAKQESTLESALKEMAEDIEAPKQAPHAQPSPITNPHQKRFVDIKPIPIKTHPSLAAQLENHANIQHVEPAASAQMGVIKRGSSLEGVVRRPATLHIQVPQRTAQKTIPRPRQTTPAGERVFIEGISAPKRAVSF